jgi:glycosyltransferase involved in cell wall biosynthesis
MNFFSKKKILIFIPAYNVEKKIYSVISRIPSNIFYINHVNILIINDFSSDNTKKVIKNIKNDFNYDIEVFETKKNLGYGGVQKYAFNYAIKNQYDYIIMLHGDGQYLPEKLPEFIEKFDNDNLDAVFGSRMKSYFSALRGGMPIYKFLGNIVLTFIQNMILGSKMSEFHSGYRSYKVKSLQLIDFNKMTNYYHFDTEIIIELLKKNLLILEINIPTFYGDEVSHLKSIPYGFKVLISTIKSKFKK